MATLAQLRTKVARRLEDVANAHWSTAELDDFINEARMDMWQMVRRLNPSVLPLSSNTWTWPANTRSANLTVGDGTIGGLGTTDFDIYLVSMTGTTASVGPDNLPVPLPRVPYEEINRGGVGGSLWHEDNNHYGSLVQGSPSPWGYDGVDSGVSTANTWHGGSKASVYAWALQGHQLFLTPVPRTDVQMHVEYIAPFSTLVADVDVFDNDNSMFRPWEAIIELGAVLAAKGRSDEGSDSIMQQWQYKMDLFTRWLEHREITGTPKVLVDGY